MFNDWNCGKLSHVYTVADMSEVIDDFFHNLWSIKLQRKNENTHECEGRQRSPFSQPWKIAPINGNDQANKEQ